MRRVMLLAIVVAGLVGCGGSGGGTVGAPGAGPGSGGGGGGSCQSDFTPERVAAGENCDPALNRAQFCPLVPGSEYVRSRSQVIACDGVNISEHEISGGGFETHYVAIRREGAASPSAIYLALHYLGGSAEYFANLIRMTELAKARNVLVIVPQAPGLAGTAAVARWPTSLNQPVESYLQLLEAVVGDARSRFGASGQPLYAAGLSNGVPMAYFFACGRANLVDAFLAVAGNQNQDSAAACLPSRPIGFVAIHGTLDPVIPYGGIVGVLRSIPENYEAFKTLNQCVGQDRNAVLVGAQGDVSIDWAPSCAGGRRMVLASLIGNGHNWPGDDAGLLQEAGVTLGLFGPARNDIDATIQGFDLLRYAGGN